MPRTRASDRLRSTQQNTLSFSNKITKSSAGSQASRVIDGKTKKPVAKAVEPAPLEQDVAKPSPPTKAASPSTIGELAETSSRPLSVRQQPQAPQRAELHKEDDEARTISEAQLRKYWKAKEDDRIFPRVHQQSLSMHEKILREFDLSSQFGPCVGITRTKRWRRAQRMGFKPPLEVLTVLLRDDKSIDQQERSQVDTLMATRFDMN